GGRPLRRWWQRHAIVLAQSLGKVGQLPGGVGRQPLGLHLEIALGGARFALGGGVRDAPTSTTATAGDARLAATVRAAGKSLAVTVGAIAVASAITDHARASHFAARQPLAAFARGDLWCRGEVVFPRGQNRRWWWRRRASPWR